MAFLDTFGLQGGTSSSMMFADTSGDEESFTIGASVRVLPDRSFKDFGGGDTGVVVRVDSGVGSVDVLFDGRAAPLTVALRHLEPVRPRRPLLPPSPSMPSTLSRKELSQALELSRVSQPVPAAASDGYERALYEQHERFRLEAAELRRLASTGADPLSAASQDAALVAAVALPSPAPSGILGSGGLWGTMPVVPPDALGDGVLGSPAATLDGGTAAEDKALAAAVQASATATAATRMMSMVEVVALRSSIKELKEMLEREVEQRVIGHQQVQGELQSLRELVELRHSAARQLVEGARLELLEAAAAQADSRAASVKEAVTQVEQRVAGLHHVPGELDALRAHVELRHSSAQQLLDGMRAELLEAAAAQADGRATSASDAVKQALHDRIVVLEQHQLETAEGPATVSMVEVVDLRSSLKDLQDTVEREVEQRAAQLQHHQGELETLRGHVELRHGAAQQLLEAMRVELMGAAAERVDGHAASVSETMKQVEQCLAQLQVFQGEIETLRAHVELRHSTVRQLLEGMRVELMEIAAAQGDGRTAFASEAMRHALHDRVTSLEQRMLVLESATELAASTGADVAPAQQLDLIMELERQIRETRGCEDAERLHVRRLEQKLAASEQELELSEARTSLAWQAAQQTQAQQVAIAVAQPGLPRTMLAREPRKTLLAQQPALIHQSALAQSCLNCSTTFLSDSLFCQQCGTQRPSLGAKAGAVNVVHVQPGELVHGLR